MSCGKATVQQKSSCSRDNISCKKQERLLLAENWEAVQLKYSRRRLLAQLKTVCSCVMRRCGSPKLRRTGTRPSSGPTLIPCIRFRYCLHMIHVDPSAQAAAVRSPWVTRIVACNLHSKEALRNIECVYNVGRSLSAQQWLSCALARRAHREKI